PPARRYHHSFPTRRSSDLWTTLKYPYTVYPILHGRRGVHPTAEWTVISYDLARSETVWRALAKGKYDLLILDEAHYLKTIDARRDRKSTRLNSSHVAISYA